MTTRKSGLLPGRAALAVTGSLAHRDREGSSIEGKARKFEVQTCSQTGVAHGAVASFWRFAGVVDGDGFLVGVHQAVVV